MITGMLFMVVEHFKGDDPTAAGQRFAERGRMLPDGVRYVSSWMEASGARCWQVMEADSRERLDEWIACWSDLVEFDVIPIQSSPDFWARRR
jgi:hypothetical protein